MKNKTIIDSDGDKLVEELRETNAFLMKLVDTIPAKMYFEQDIKEHITTAKHSAMDIAAAALKRKPNDVQLSAKAKHKRARLDPAQQKSVSEIQAELSQKKVKTQKGYGLETSFTPAAEADDLRQKLQERIEFLKAQRNATATGSGKKHTLKLKIKKLKKKKLDLVKANDLKKIEKPKISKLEPVPPVFNKEINLIYSKFDFDEDGIKEKKKNEYTGKKVKTLLKQAERKKEKIENLKSTDPEKAKAVLEKDKWKKAIQKSEGMKVKDDPNLLKKSLKREEKKKKKSAKAWKGRTEDTEKRKKVRQEKRNKNIQQRKQEKFQKKFKSAKKKGRIMPGFKK